MSVVLIDVLPGVPDQDLTVQLDELSFDLRLLWNARAGRWTLDLSDGEGALFRGHVLSEGWPVLRRYQHHRAPLGELLVLDSTGRGEEPGLEDLGARHLLCYVEAST